MRNAIRLFSGLTVFLLAAGLVQADTNSNAGLWVGEVTLTGVNETVSGINAANQVVSPDPSVTTPANSPAHMRIILLVDSNGVVNLLKSVALIKNDTNIVLLTDPTTYSQYGSQTGQRLTAVAFDFGDGPAAQNALDALATAAATAAVNGLNATNAAKASVNFSRTNNIGNATAGYTSFVLSTNFNGLETNAAIAAVQGLVGVAASVPTPRKIEIASLAAISALKDAGAYTAADGLSLTQLPLSGQLTNGGTLTGTIYLGADHPTNPFRHKWNPIERHGYAITRNLTITVDSTPSTNATVLPGFGVNYLTGRYRENIFGLHKPLGPNQDIGLITDGTFQLERVYQQ
jgi:hypothetical protein